jgi:acetylornithine deacetylase
MLNTLTAESIELLQALIERPSFSKEEEQTADCLQDFLSAKGLRVHRKGNNIWVYNRHFDPKKPTILLNSHHDTVKPNPNYTRDPFKAEILDGKLYGLGSNDAGGCLVSLIAAFLYYESNEGLAYNLCLAATAEEEISGKHGIESVIPDLGELSFAIVGEPTLMQMAVAEKGLMVLDCEAVGVAGHAAREEGVNAIYQALPAIQWFATHRFERVSPISGPVKMSVTVVQAGSQHNVVPATCSFVVDIRMNECYTHEELLEEIGQHVNCRVKPRSTRLKPSSIPMEHPLVQAGLSLGLTAFSSPTMSDQALLSIPSLKIGPGDSARSHTADEFVWVEEIEAGIRTYTELLARILIV